MVKIINIKDILYIEAEKVQPGHIMHNGVILDVYKQEGSSGRKTIFWLETADASSWAESGQKVPILGVASPELLASIRKVLSEIQAKSIRFDARDAEVQE